MRSAIVALLVGALALTILVSCGGGSTITNDTQTPGQSFDDQIRLVSPFTLDDADHNGITGRAVIDGVALTEGGYPMITVPIGKSEIKASFAITGHGFIQPGGMRMTSAITDFYDVSSGTQMPLCTAKTSVAGLPDVSSRLDILRENQETIRIEELRQKQDREVEVAVTLKADPTVAQRIAGRNMGIKEIPAERRVEIEHRRNNANSLLGLVAGVVIHALLGDVIGASSGVVEIACGDPVVVLHAKLVLKGTGGGITPPPANKPPMVILVANPASGNAPLQTALTAVATDSDGTIVKYEWAFPGDGGYSMGNVTITHTFPTPGDFTVKVRVTDDDGATAVDDATIIVGNAPPPANKPPVALFTANPTSGVVPLTVHVDGSASYDPDGTIVKFEWFFYGGGGHADIGGTTMDHSYDTPGAYSVWLRVTDDDGATGWSTSGVEVTVNAPPVDEYAGASILITPQNPTLDSGAGDEQQFVARIYASDGLTQLPIPAAATVVWDSSVPGSITQTGYFYSVLAAGQGTIHIRAVITWTGHELAGETTVQVN